MTTLEIIHVRAVSISVAELSEMIEASIRSASDQSEVVQLRIERRGGGR